MKLAKLSSGLILTMVIGACTPDSSAEKESGLPDLDKVDASKVLKVGFKEWLKQSGYSVDINQSNPHETFQPGNHYSNHFYNLVVDFPNSWTSDRGAGPYTLFRAYQGDSAVSISLQVTTVNITGQESSRMSAAEISQLEEQPLEFQNTHVPEGYESYMRRQLKNVSGVEPIDLHFEERRMGRMVYLVTSFRDTQWLEDVEYYVMNENWVTNKWGNTYTISYSAPEVFYDPDLVATVANQAQFMNPEFLNGPR